MKIFITGATGFMGSHLLERLVGKGEKVAIYVRENSNFSRISQISNNKNVSFIYEQNLDKYFKETPPEYVIHLGTCYKKQHSPEDITTMIDSNITLPTKILQLCSDNRVKYFINTGTFFEYSYESDETITEETETGACNLYASTKLAFNEILKFFSKEKNIKTINLRLFSPYGKKDNFKIIPLIIQKILSGENIHLINQKLCFTYVEDIIDAYILVLKNIPKIFEQYTELNIASKSHYISEVVDILEKISNKKLSISGGTYQEHSEKNVNCNTNKAQRLLGWKQNTPLETGLSLTYNYYKNENS